MGRGNKRRMLDSMGEPATVIGSGTEFMGEFRGRGHILVCGVVRGDSALDGSVTVAEGARWHGALAATDIILAGEVEGDVSASDRVEIRPTARIRGSVTAGRIAIGEGAVVDGELKTSASGHPHRFEEKRHIRD
jgi:cytoskeletal protein CcmA (bactofilin family)